MGSAIIETIMIRTNYIFVDFENVPETELERIQNRPAHVTIILGERHQTLPVPLVNKMLSFPGQIELVKNSRAGKNASDMVLAARIGLRWAKNPEGFFHIIAKDRGYEALIGHLKEEGVFAAQHHSLATITVLMNQNERLKYLRDGYASSRLSAPARRKSLESQIQHVFAHTPSDEEVEELIRKLVEVQVIRLTDNDRVVFAKQESVAAAA